MIYALPWNGFGIGGMFWHLYWVIPGTSYIYWEGADSIFPISNLNKNYNICYQNKYKISSYFRYNYDE